ncbi:MAG: T9SS type A sorting domain-containing protein, partial [Rhodothermales bacterium]
GFFPRIYAVVDPNGSVEEVHEDNNTGWNVLPVASGPVSIEDDGPSALETSPAIYQNYPNPFNGTTTIAFDLPKPERATIQVVDLLGREVSRVVDQVFDAGSYNVRFDARDLSSGVYLYRLVAGETVQTKQMMVVR